MSFIKVVAVLLACCLYSCATGKEKHIEQPALPRHVDPTANVAHNWPVPPDEAFHLLAHERLTIRAMKSAGGGVTGARKLTLHFPSARIVLEAKWKPAPGGDLDSWNNSPRKELAAYAVQRWFLDADDLVVPTTVPRCIPLTEYRRFHADAEATVPGTRCVLGVLSLWMKNVTVPGRLYDESRFAEDAAYAYHMANFNLLTYLVDHRDGRSGNFLVSNDPSNRRIFAIDNGVSFDPWIYNFFVRNWNEIDVPALRRESVERLRRLAVADVHALGVLAELRRDDHGLLRLVEPGPNLGQSKGTRVRNGIVQLGLTDDEIEEAEERLEELLKEADENHISLF